jgi:3'-phosphoadenosine 5'-phosphosulfate sulfotransferase (PAPS reductase)/FAD synthetase
VKKLPPNAKRVTGNPYKIEGPALISFSGGRTSGYMLHEILCAHDGKLPDDVHVCFANTGKEREETLRFVHECGSHWGVHVNWLEWRDAKPCFEDVGFNSASRNGEPFEALMAKKKRVPNWQERWCTQYLKVMPMLAKMESLGFPVGSFGETIGLRHDEGHRILKGLARADNDGRRVAYPLAKAKIRKPDVLAFWRDQPFDLGLEAWEGNCDLCFLKGRVIRKRIIRDEPSRAAWWIGEEAKWGFFDRRDRVHQLVKEVQRSPELGDDLSDEEYDAECGLHCGEAA